MEQLLSLSNRAKNVETCQQVLYEHNIFDLLQYVKIKL